MIGSVREPEGPPAAGARLIDVHTPATPAGVVLVLHGGAARRRSRRVSAAQLSVLRMIPIATRIEHITGGRLAVLRMLNSQRGWEPPTPVDDVDWALTEIAARFGAELPVCIVGHSLGGRAALLSADRPQVKGVVALAPWVLPDDPVRGQAEAPVVIIHGAADRVATPVRARQVAETLARTAPVHFVTVRRGAHGMLRRVDDFDGLAARCVLWMLLGEVQGETVRRIAAGERWLEI